jgi:uncharacterized protein YkwD
VEPTTTATDSPPQSADHPTHTVQPGDTLLGLAKQYGVPMAAIQLQNDLGESTTVQAGQTLSIPAKEEWEGSSPFWIIHEVRPGETLIGIARRYNLEPEDMQTVNGLEDADRIVVGQSLILPLVGPATASTSMPIETPLTTSPPPTASPTVSATLGTNDTPVADPNVAPAPQSGAPPADLAAWPREIAELINEVRAQHGLDALTYDTTLERAAQAHADDCAQRGWCSHTGSDGANIKIRVTRIGYEASGWAECWAQTQSPQRAVEVWMDETPPNDPHRSTLLSDWLSEIGIGVSEADWGKYIIADLGRP